MNLNEALDFLDSAGSVVVQTDQFDKDILDIQDYVLHHVRYQGLGQLQIIMDWLSFDNANEDCFMRWIQNNYNPDVDFRTICDNCILAAELHLNKKLNSDNQEIFYVAEI